MTRYFRYLIYSVIALSALSLSSCEELDDGEFSVYVRMDGEKLSGKGGSAFVVVTSSVDWNLALEPNGDSGVWGALNQYSGSGSKSNIIFTYEENTAEEERSIVVVLTSRTGHKEARCTVVQGIPQAGGGETPNPPVPPVGIQSDPVPGWLELPLMSEEKNLYFLTHYQTFPSTGTTLRSWSCRYDTDALVSHWVAYPMNATTIGSGSRTDKWGLDPKVPRELQAVLYSGYKGGYDRGHQLPSADLLNYEANVTTFYGTNMTPQLGTLNQNVWANLESKVRDWARAFDTLYVVTGCVIEGSTKVAYDNDGKAVTVPVGYYKALLGYKKNGTVGITPTTGGYTSIAFYFDHAGYSGSYMDKAMTVDALEEKVGEDFFVNLPGKIGNDLAGRVESTRDEYWY